MTATGCIFCGRGPLTREHLWPDWLRRQLDIRRKSAHRIEGEEDGAERRDFKFETPPYNHTVRAVCGSCNGGWMSEIEAEAKPILEPLLRAGGGNLDRSAQQALASWALLKACAFDEVHPKERVVPEAHRQYLFSHKEPPPDGVWVRLATYEAKDLGHYAYQGLKLTRDDKPPTHPNVYFVTITTGALVVQVTGSLLPEFTFADVPYPPEMNVVEIWPSNADDVEFVQQNLMSHDTLIGFSQVLYNVFGKLTGGAPPAR